MDKINISESFLISGNDFNIDQNIVCKHPTVGEILSLGNGVNAESVYWDYVYSIACDPYDYMVMLDDIGIDYETVEPMDVFAIKWSKAIEQYSENKDFFDNFNYNPLNEIKNALKFFLGNHNFDLIKNCDDSDNVDYLLIDKDTVHDNTCNYMITRKNFNYIFEFINKINIFDKSQRIHPANQSTKQILIDDTRDEIKRKQRHPEESLNDSYIGKSISAVCFGGNGNISIFNVNSVKIYQLFKAFNIIQKKENVNHVLNGIYFGTVDKSKLNEEKDLNWII